MLHFEPNLLNLIIKKFLNHVKLTTVGVYFTVFIAVIAVSPFFMRHGKIQYKCEIFELTSGRANKKKTFSNYDNINQRFKRSNLAQMNEPQEATAKVFISLFDFIELF